MLARNAIRLALTLLWFTSGCAGLVATGSSGRTNADEMLGKTVGRVVIGQPLPNLTVRDLSGKQRTLSEFRGQVVLLDIWATWCEPCKVELPMLDDIAGRLRSRGVVVLAVSVDQEERNMRSFIDQKRRNWHVTFLHDPDSTVPDALLPPKMPTSYVLDKQGIVRMVNQGFDRADAKHIEKKLAELAAGG